MITKTTTIKTTQPDMAPITFPYPVAWTTEAKHCKSAKLPKNHNFEPSPLILVMVNRSWSCFSCSAMNPVSYMFGPHWIPWEATIRFNDYVHGFLLDSIWMFLMDTWRAPSEFLCGLHVLSTWIHFSVSCASCSAFELYEFYLWTTQEPMRFYKKVLCTWVPFSLSTDVPWSPYELILHSPVGFM